MIECPVCHESFPLERSVIYLNDRYCTELCAEIAAREGKNTSEPVEPEAQKTG